MKEDFNKFIEIYENSKSIIKDNSFKTIEKLMSLFKNNFIIKINDGNALNFLINDKIMFKFKEEEKYLNDIEKEYLFLIYLSQKENISQEFHKKIFIYLLNAFDPIKIFLNIKFYKKCFKYFMNKINHMNIVEIINNNINNDNNNQNINKKKVINFLYYYNYFLNKEEKNINLDINFGYIKLLFDLKEILNLYISKETDSISCQNYFNYLFNKHFFCIQKISSNIFISLITKFLELLNDYIINDNNNSGSLYENFLYIISYIICPLNEEDIKIMNEIKNKNGEIINKIKEDIIISNNSILHQISVNLLNKNEKKLDKDFMIKFISIYEVLDGFNCHLFKSLEAEFKSILLFINNKKIDNINEYMNLFILLNKKVFNHDNSRIHKYFIKTICKMNEINNEIFSSYLFHYFLININSPMLYPENEKNIYQYKVGILINKFMINYLNQKNNNKFLFDYIHGISMYSTNNKIIPYLISSIDNIKMSKEDFIVNMSNKNNNDIFKDILNIIEKMCIRCNSQYQRFKNYETISNLILNILNSGNDFLLNKNEIMINLVEIYSLLFDYLLNFNKDILSLEYINFSDITLFDKDNIIFKTLLSLKNIIRSNINCSDDFEVFINNNKFIKNILNKKHIYLLFFSINDNEILNNYLILNSQKIFSDYLTKEQKEEYINKFNIILNIQKIFLSEKKNNIIKIKEIFDNIFITLKNFCNSNIDINNIPFDFYEKYENIIFNYNNTYKIGFNDILINEIQFIQNSNNFNYKLLFIKTLLFSYLSFLHYEIYNAKKEENIINTNIILKNNLENITSFLINNDTKITEINKIMYYKCFILCLISLNTFDNKKFIFDIMSKIENNNSKLNINYISNFFDILIKGDLYYIIKFFEIYFNIIDFNDENEEKYLEIYKSCIEKGIKCILENRENFTFLNIITLLNILLNKKFLSKKKFIPIIKSHINKFMDLNDKKIWLLLKFTIEVLLYNIHINNNLLEIYEDIIIELSIIKETRGDDSFMIQTSPLYIKSPFNIKIKNILPYDEKISKYGIYIRYSILYFFENLIKNLNKNENIINIILNIILQILERINIKSGQRPEMIFTDKHREKLRLSQLLVTLGTLFMYIIKNCDEKKINDFSEQNKEILEKISKNLIEIFNKTNLQSVDFYLYNFNLQFLLFSASLRKYYYNSMSEPKTKSHIVSACLIIISIAIIEKIITDKNEINKFINAITIQCTSNICNVRGFAQFFIDKIFNSKELIENNDIELNDINKSFITYLKQNPNIQKFFSKFDEKYNKYTELIKDFSVQNLLKDNLDEIYAEIVPMDIINTFKNLSADNLVLDNIEFGKIASNWRFVFDVEKELKEINNNINNDIDFQKKYRPLDTNIYHDFSKKRKRHDIIVVASLIDKAPNLGGLTRTCEIFNIGALTIPNESILKDTAFLRAAASGEKWTPILSIPPCTVKEFIISYKKMGYKIIGLEQTQNSIDVRKYEFKEKTVIILGNEKEGIPQDIINLIDNCVIIPQYGNIRSLNVHVSAAIMLWQCIQCINKNNI